jgi:hypothetical protein
MIFSANQKRPPFLTALLSLALLLSSACCPPRPKIYILTLTPAPSDCRASDLTSLNYKTAIGNIAEPAVPPNRFAALEEVAHLTTIAVLEKCNLRPEKFTFKAVADPLDAGRVYRYPDSARYVSGANIALAAIANPGYKFLGWEEGGKAFGSGGFISAYRITHNATLTAKFERSSE